MPLTITNPFEQDGQEANNVSINAKAVMIEGLVTDLKKENNQFLSDKRMSRLLSTNNTTKRPDHKVHHNSNQFMKDD